MHRIAIFASGTGSNAQKIMEHFEGHHTIKVALVVSNKKEAPVLQIAERFGVKTVVVDKKFNCANIPVMTTLLQEKIDFIVLAGFLLLVPSTLVKAYDKRMVNIHPALLPKFGGKGMYGMHVHEAVKSAQEKETGITIHYVNTAYDEGDILFQARCPVSSTDSPQEIAKNVRVLEHAHFANVIEKIILADLSNKTQSHV